MFFSASPTSLSSEYYKRMSIFVNSLVLAEVITAEYRDKILPTEDSYLWTEQDFGVNCVPLRELSLLGHVLLKGSAEHVTFLIGEREQVPLKTSKSSYLPVLSIAIQSKVDLHAKLRLLLEHTEESELIACSSDGLSVFHSAALRGADEETLSLLLAKPCLQAIKDEKDIYGLTALDYAIRLGNEPMMHTLNPDTIFDPTSPPPFFNVGIFQVSQQRLNERLKNFIALPRAEPTTERDHKTINSVAMCNGWALCFQYFANENRLDEFYALLEQISRWDGKIDPKTVHFDNPLLNHYSSLEDILDEIVKITVTGQSNDPISIYDRPRQFAFLLGDDDDRKLRQIYQAQTISGVSKTQLVELLSIFQMLPETIIDIGIWNKLGGHCISLYITNDGKLQYYDSNLKLRIPSIDNSKMLADIIIKTNFNGDDKQIRLEFRIFKTYSNKASELKHDKLRLQNLVIENPECGYTKLHFAVLDAVMENNCETIKFLIENEPELLNQKNFWNHKPLDLAVTAGFEDCVVLLLPATHCSNEEALSLAADLYEKNMPEAFAIHIRNFALDGKQVEEELKRKIPYTGMNDEKIKTFLNIISGSEISKAPAPAAYPEIAYATMFSQSVRSRAVASASSAAAEPDSLTGRSSP